MWQPASRQDNAFPRSMTSPVFVTIKSLKFHNLSASLCCAERHARIQTSAEKTKGGGRLSGTPSAIYSP